jgi:hypothetical protein
LELHRLDQHVACQLRHVAHAANISAKKNKHHTLQVLSDQIHPHRARPTSKQPIHHIQSNKAPVEGDKELPAQREGPGKLHEEVKLTNKMLI